MESRWIINDPGWVRLRTASRALVALVASAVIGYLVLVQLLGQSFTVIIPVFGLVITTILGVHGSSRKIHKIAVLLTPIPAMISATVASLLVGHSVLSPIIFLSIIFVAVLVRWFGGNGQSYGMIAYMTYFIIGVAHIKVSQLGGVCIALAISACCVYAVVFWILRDKPENILLSAIYSLRLRAALLVETHAQIYPGEKITSRQRRLFEKGQERLNATALMIESQLEKIEPGRFTLKNYNKNLSSIVFRFELQTEAVIVAWKNAQPTSAEHADSLQTRVLHLADGLRGSRQPGSASLDYAAFPSPSSRLVIASIRDLTKTTRQLAEMNVRRAVHELRTGSNVDEISGHAKKRGDIDKPLFIDVIKTAIQTLIATGLAIWLGSMLSDDRSYWAVISAFVTFVGTRSRGEMAYKGWQRSLGTVGGVILGAIIGTFISSNPVIDSLLIGVLVFLAIYAFQRSYVLMVLWMTAVMALIYSLIGFFSIDVMGLRLVETLIGVAVGSAVGFFVFPIRTEDRIRHDVASGLRDLHDVVREVNDAKFDNHQLAKEARDLDKTLQQLRRTAQAYLNTTWLSNENSARQVRLLTRAAYVGRQLSRRRVNWPVTPRKLRQPITTAMRDLLHNLTRTANCLDNPTQSKKNFRRVDQRIDEFNRHLNYYRNLAPEKQPKNMRHLEALLHIMRQLDQVVTNIRATL